jgi:hypothetical protein
MCVILLASEGSRISPASIADAFAANDDGAGIAWREEKDGVKGIAWKKGLDLEEITHLCQTTPLPYCAHFRVASCGGVRDELTHPFPVHPDVPLWLEGWTPGPVLFHNGHWNAFDTRIWDIALRGGFKIPPGKWSDSRVMAWIAANVGLGALEFIPGQRICIFGPQEVEDDPSSGIYLYSDDWKIDTENIWMSNTTWRGSRQWKATNKGGTKLPADAKEGDSTRSRTISTPSGSGSSGQTAGDTSKEPKAPDRVQVLIDGKVLGPWQCDCHVWNGPTYKYCQHCFKVRKEFLEEGKGGLYCPPSPFDRKGRLIREITAKEMLIWHRLVETRDSCNRRLLSKKKYKRYLRAWEIQQGEKRRQAIEEAAKRTQPSMDSPPRRGAAMCSPEIEERIQKAQLRMADLQTRMVH